MAVQAQTATQTPPPPPASPQPVFTVTVIEAAPLVGVDLPIEKIPAPVQVATSEAIERSGALELSAFLNRRFNGVYVNEIQSNPFQPESTIADIPRHRCWARRRECPSTWTVCASISRLAMW